MQSHVPKQYLTLHGQPIIVHTLHTLLSSPDIEKVVVVLAPHDTHWPVIKNTLPAQDRILIATGSHERHLSVLNGLAALSTLAQADDWVLVHDAVRPYLTLTDLNALITELSEHPVGGLLGCPVKDTLKRVDPQGEIIETIDRSNVWHAQTPQMFRYAQLVHALQHAVHEGQTVTDEASAFELIGLRPKIVRGQPSNIKITSPEDLA